MSNNKKRRYRGLNLTTKGFKKLQEGIAEWERKNNWGDRYSLQELADLTRLSFGTITKVLNQAGVVDRSTIRIFFLAFGLELLLNDYEQPELEILEKQQNNHQDWGLAVDISNFYGREENIATLTDWIVEKHCRLILLLGMGGAGKTFLSIKVAQLIQDKFDFVIWRSLKPAVCSQEMIDNWISILSQEKKIQCSVRELVDYLQHYKCLLILDGLEILLESKNHQGKYQKTYENYSQLLDILGTTSHQSCVIITSRENPENVNDLEEKNGKIRSLYLNGDGCDLIPINLISNKNDAQKIPVYLCDYYAHNYILIKIIIKYNNKLFAGNLEQFIAQEIRLFNEINNFINEHFDRLSPLEIMIINQFKDEENPLDLRFISKKRLYY